MLKYSRMLLHTAHGVGHFLLVELLVTPVEARDTLTSISVASQL